MPDQEVLVQYYFKMIRERSPMYYKMYTPFYICDNANFIYVK